MKAKTLTGKAVRLKIAKATLALRMAEVNYRDVITDVQRRCEHQKCEWQSVYEDSHYYCSDCGGSWDNDPRKTTGKKGTA